MARPRNGSNKAAKKAIVAHSAPGKKRTGAKQPATKTQINWYMAEQMEVSPKQIDAVLDLLIGTVTTWTRKNREFTIPGLGKLVKAQRLLGYAEIRPQLKR